VPLDFHDDLMDDLAAQTPPGHTTRGRRSGAAAAPSSRPYIGILFECCGVYARVYRRPDQDHYRGRCPRCLARVEVRVGPDGVSTRIFRAS
jgi:hypothetical protein